MTISRGQMERQLRMGGGIMDVVPREPAIFGGIKKAVKKVGKTVSKIAKSDIGKAALLYGATAGLGSIGSGQTGLARFAPSNFMGNLSRIGSFISGGTLMDDPTGLYAEGQIPGKKNIFQKALSAVGIGDGKMGNIGKLATLGAVSTFLTKTLGMTPEQAEEELARDPSTYLEQYYRNLNPPTADTTSEEYEKQVRDFVTTNTSEYAVGGRVGFAEGTYKDFEEFMMRRSESMSERQKEELRKQFEMYMRSKDPTVEAAEGGRIGFADGPVLPPDPTQPVNPFKPKPIGPVLPDRMMASDDTNDRVLEALFEKYLDMGLSPKDAAEKAREEFERMGKGNIKETRGLAALGGRMGFDEGTSRRGLMGSVDETMDIPMQDEDTVVIITMDENGMPVLKQVPRSEVMPKGVLDSGRTMKAKGDTASDNAMQAAGIEGLPIRQNPKGVKELDLRDNGGFIPPVGIKEKEDDIPAMLSNNEFVFTADAVRGMGDGNVNVGAQRMYDMMKKLEAGGRV